MNSNNAVAKTIAQQIIGTTMASAETFGVKWPDQAQFAVFNSIGYFTRGRIVGSDAIVVRFFNDVDALHAHFVDVESFEHDTGTRMAQMVYEWDLGPHSLPQHDVDAYAMLADIANGNTRILRATHRPLSQQAWNRIHGDQFENITHKFTAK